MRPGSRFLYGNFFSNLNISSPGLGYKQYFLLDPEFPDRLLQSGYRRTVDFIHFLFEHYSKRDLIYKTDRVVAISALEARTECWEDLKM